MNGRRVLVVDDDAGTRRLIGEILRPLVFDVDFAEDGAQALEQVRASVPDLVILDIALPRLTGWQVLAAIRQGRAPRVPVIVITAHGQGMAAERALDGGAHRFFEKPFIPSELAEAVCDLLPTAPKRDSLAD